MHDDWYHERWGHPDNASGITRLELITGWALGSDARAPDIMDFAPSEDPVAAVEQALLPAVAKAPCYVSFSGGRDSSVLLALAARVARREGLDDPVPITMRFRDAPEGEESEWQADVLRFLNLHDRQLVHQLDEVDLVGGEWQRSVGENGLQWPPAAHGLLPLQRAARGGSFVHGDGGDQVFGGWTRARIAEMIRRRRWPGLRAARGLVRAYAPAPARRAIETRRAITPAPWLVPAARRVWAMEQGRTYAAEPRSWPEFLRWTRRERATVLMLDTLERQSVSAGAELCTPFWDPRFLRALAQWGGRLGNGNRTSVMVALFAGLLPEHVLRRSTKAHFTRAFFSEATRRFARDWRGPVPEPDVVTREPLRDAWLSDLPPNTSAVLLQASWLLANGGRNGPADTSPGVGPALR